MANSKKKKSTDAEFKEIEQMYAGASGKKSSSPVLLICICAVALVAILVGGWFLLQDHILQMEDVTLAGVSMEGKSKRDAKEALQEIVDQSISKNTMVVTVEDTVVMLTPAVSGVTVDVDAAVDAAYTHAKQSAEPFDMTPYITLDREATMAALASIAEKYNTALGQTTYTLEGEIPSLAHDAQEEEAGQTLVLKMGTPQYGLDMEVLYQQILAAYSTNVFEVVGQCEIKEPERLSADALYEKYLTAPQDAVMDESFKITPETYGYSVDLAKAQELLKDLDYGQEVRIPFAKVAPEVTVESIESTLYQDLLGECKTPYSGHDDNNRNTNLRLACEAMNGTVLLPGEIFSYNETLGERTPERGWKPAASYVNGLTVDTYGGGICQGSTTVYYSAVLAGMKILNRYPHGYISSYVDPGMDASVNWGTADFRFQNTSEYPIKITAVRANGYLHVQIWGTETRDYYIKMTYAILGSKNYETEYREMAADNPQGYKDGQVLVTPYVGYTVQTYMNKYDRETNELISTEKWTYDVYSARNKVVVKIVENGGGTGSTEGGGDNAGGENTGGGTEDGGNTGDGGGTGEDDGGVG